jgi:O-antigen ligase
MISLLYFFNKYFYNKKFINILIFFVILTLIVFSNQRTVWASTLMGFLLNIIFISRSNFRIDMGALTPVLLMVSIVVIIVSTVIITNEEIMATFEKRIKGFTHADNDDEGGTAAWRRQQWESYLPVVEQNLLLGLRLKGFEYPVLFYHFEGSMWENTGHHFHSYYLDKLFYFGIAGLLMSIVPLYFYILKLIFFVRKFIISEQIILASYIMTFGVFGIGYDVPFSIYGLVGLGLAYLERDYTNTRKKENVTEKAIATPQ